MWSKTVSSILYNRGVLQGLILSPILFYSLLDELPELLKKENPDPRDSKLQSPNQFGDQPWRYFGLKLPQISKSGVAKKQLSEKAAYALLKI